MADNTVRIISNYPSDESVSKIGSKEDKGSVKVEDSKGNIEYYRNGKLVAYKNKNERLKSSTAYDVSKEEIRGKEGGVKRIGEVKVSESPQSTTEVYGESKADIVKSQEAQVAANQSTTFYDKAGKGYSYAPALVPTSIKDKGFGYKEVTYADKKKRTVQTGTTEVYGSEISGESSSISKPSSNIFVKGYENIGVVESEALREQSDILSKTSKNEDNGLISFKPTDVVTGIKLLPSGAKLFGIGVVKYGVYPFLTPIKTTKELFGAIKNPKATGLEIYKQFKTNPAGFAGGFYGAGKVLQVGELGVGTVRSGVIKFVSKDVSYSKFLEPKVSANIIAGKTDFPTSTSIKGALKDFEGGRTSTRTIKVVSASPQPITSFKQSRNVFVGKGTGVSRTEGLYAAAYGKGSPYFFSIGKESGYSFSILPKIAEKPTLSVIEVGGISRIPSNVLRLGVDYENLFLQTKGVSGSTKAYITGNLERQFNPKLPKAFKTSETEVVIPAGSELKSTGGLLGFRESFSFKGRRIPIREYKVVGENTAFKFDNPFMSKGKTVVEGSKITYYTPKKNVSLSGSFLRSSLSKSSNVFSSLKSSLGSSMNSFRSGFSSLSSTKSSSKSFSVSSIMRSLGRSSKVYSVSSPKYSFNYASSYNSSKGYFGSSKSIISKPNSKKDFSDPTGLKKSYKSKPLEKFKYGYSPSIEAGLFNIRGKRISNVLASSGLVLRPIISRGVA